MQSEGDAWFERNQVVLNERDYANDLIVKTIFELSGSDTESPGERVKILEVGCGEGNRLEYLAADKLFEVFGIDPSSCAIEKACKRGVQASVGTADQLSFEDSKFDFLVFGFCLYLCDREDLFQIAQEAHRVLKSKSWLIIYDFYATDHIRRKYLHKEGLFTYKMDYSTLFTWHPEYTFYQHQLRNVGQAEFTDDQSNWVSLSVIRKKSLDA